jgi:hypothetical protein
MNIVEIDKYDIMTMMQNSSKDSYWAKLLNEVHKVNVTTEEWYHRLQNHLKENDNITLMMIKIPGRFR